MSTRQRFAAILAVAASCAASAMAQPVDRPNILFFMGDDWSWPHAGAYGESLIKTPAFDRVAREGVLFRNAFVSSPSCTPSRLAVATGQWHWRLEEGKNLGGSLREGVSVYPEMLQAAGYQIGFAFKGATPSKYKYTHRDPFGPWFKTFEEFFARREAGTPFCFWHGPSDTHRPYRYGEGMANGIDPAKVRLPACLPDSEVTRRDYADYVHRIQRFDAKCERVLELLEKSGELENTIVVVSGDNGLPFPRCKATLYDTGTHVPLAIRWGAKVPGGRVVQDFVSLTDLAPTFLEATGVEVSPEMTGRSLLSILTSAESGLVDSSRTHVLTGMDLHVYANPCRALRTADLLYIRNFDPEKWPNWPTGKEVERFSSIDYTDGTWPDGRYWTFGIDPSPTKQFLIDRRDQPEVKPFFELTCRIRPEEELFDLRKDPDQLHNVVSDPSYAATLSDMRNRLTTELRTSGDPLLAKRDKTAEAAPATGTAATARPTLQVINGSTQPVDVYWLKFDRERMFNRSVAPGESTFIPTTLGHRFAIVGQVDKSEATVTSEVRVQAFRFDPSAKDGVPGFYTQRIDVAGFLIVASAKVNPYALKEAAYLLDMMLAKRPDLRAAMIRSGARMCILAHNEYTTDLPEYKWLMKCPSPVGFQDVSAQEYRDARCRGMGGGPHDPFCSCGEENLLCYPGDSFWEENILIHELAHNIHTRGMANVDSTFDRRLEATYDAAMKAGLWKGAYASTDRLEYFAEGVQAWFDNNRENDNVHNHVNTRAELLDYDPALAELCREVFGDTVLKYTKPLTRLHGHMEGYDPAAAPTFVWPPNLKAINERIVRAAAEHKAAQNPPRKSQNLPRKQGDADAGLMPRSSMSPSRRSNWKTTPGSNVRVDLMHQCSSRSSSKPASH
jgi:hypothetical protein